MGINPMSCIYAEVIIESYASNLFGFFENLSIYDIFNHFIEQTIDNLHPFNSWCHILAFITGAVSYKII